MTIKKTFFTDIFGDEMGKFIQFIIAYFFLMSIFLGGPFLLIRLTSTVSTEKKYNYIIAESKETTKSIFYELMKYDSLTKLIDASINKELSYEKDNINKKREILIALQNDFDSIYLTQQQLRILATVMPEKQNITFREWISSSNQLYNIGVSFIISLLFYYLGRKTAKNNVTAE